MNHTLAFSDTTMYFLMLVAWKNAQISVFLMNAAKCTNIQEE